MRIELALRLAWLLVIAAPAGADAQTTKIVFIRGGPGSGGFLGGGADTHLSDVNDPSTNPGNTGFFELKSLLIAEGYSVEQVIEGPGGSSPIDLATIGLPSIDVLVFGSNNAPYSAAAATSIEEYVCGGGAALFISDANWGSNWGDAPSSDQTFLDRFDLIMNQDAGTYALHRAAGDFVINGVDHGGHPILAGPDGVVGTSDDVDDFDGEGVSPITLGTMLPGVLPIVLAKAKGTIHVNDSIGSGSTRPATPDDGALVVLEFGTGRGAGHFDRNTFFNQNGAGTSLHQLDNAQYARNLFRWLVESPGRSHGAGCAGAGGFTPLVSLDGCPRPGAAVTLEVEDALGGAIGVFLFGTSPGALPLPSGCSLHVTPVLPIPFIVALPGTGAGAGDVSIATAVPAATPPGPLHLQLFVLDAAAPGGLASSSGLDVSVF